MGDTALVVAAVGLGLSGIVSAIKLVDWFLRSDPKELLQAGRWGAVGLFALLIPLLIGLTVNRRWPEAIGLSAVMLVAFAIYGPRILGQITPRRRVAPDEAGMVQRSIVVLEDYLRRTTGAYEHDASDLRASPPQITDGRTQGDAGRAHPELSPSLMSVAEALEVLSLPPDAEASAINEAHRRLMQIVHPDRGGSQYFAVKVNQAKEILLELRAHTSPSTSAAQEERSSRDGGRGQFSESGSRKER